MAGNIGGRKGLACAIVLTSFAAAGLSSAVQAQSPAPTAAAAPALGATVLAFHADPTSLLKGNPNGGLLLVSQVQQLALADASTFPKILELVPTASEPQKRAIGEGLALASKTKILNDEPLAAEWQRRIMGSGDPVVIASATSAFGDVQIGAVGGGALGGEGGGPTTGRTTNQSVPPPAPRPSRTLAFGYSPQTDAGPSGGTGTGAKKNFALTGSESTPGGGSDASNPVSP